MSGHSLCGAGAEPSRGSGSGNHQYKRKRKTACNSEQSPLRPLCLSSAGLLTLRVHRTSLKGSNLVRHLG